MNGKNCRMLVATILAGIVAAPIAAVADTLIMRDGRQLTGTVEQVEGGYRVKSASGVVQVARFDVVEWKQATAPVAPVLAKPAVTPRPATAPAGTPLTAADKTRRTVEVLLLHGSDALALGDIKTARDCFVDVIQIDPRNRDALAMVNYCYIKLDDIPRATRSLEAALAASPLLDRGLTMNLAYALLRSRNPMRGVKVIKDYLVARPTALDEEALNAYAICLGQSSEEARGNRFWTECVAFFDQYNKRVEATRPGYKRWGVEWVPQSEWAVTDGKNKSVQARLDAKWRELQVSRSQFSNLKRQYDAAHSASRFRRTTGPTPAMIEPQLIAARDRTDSLQAQYNELSAELIKPKLPVAFSPVPMDELPSVAIASAANTSSSPGVNGSASSPGLRSDPPATPTPPTLVRPNSTPQPQPQPVTPPVAVTPPAAQPDPTPAPPPEPRKRAIFTSACGFAVSPDLIVTTAASVDGATRITVQPSDGDPMDAELVKSDPASGLALLRVKDRKVAYLPVGDSFAGGAVQCVSFPTASMFDPTAEIIAGSSAPPREDWQIRLSKHPRLAGAPILFDGKVIGVELATRETVMTTIPSATLGALKQLIGTVPPAAALANPTRAVLMVSGVREK